MIDRVTITGADDSINPRGLLEYSQMFPFVEWGILFGSKEGPSPRFPSNRWISGLCDLIQEGSLPVQISAHLCGKWVRDWVTDAAYSWRDRYFKESAYFQRIQFNFHRQYHRAALGFFETLRYKKDFIFQVDGVNDTEVIEEAVLLGLGNTAPLYDTSGGAGIVPSEWPHPMADVYCGYAGGLGPDNLKQQIESILAITGEARIWIDMETKVRSADDRQFDLIKVRQCLEIAKEYVSL